MESGESGKQFEILDARKFMVIDIKDVDSWEDNSFWQEKVNEFNN